MAAMIVGLVREFRLALLLFAVVPFMALAGYVIGKVSKPSWLVIGKVSKPGYVIGKVSKPSQRSVNLALCTK